MEEAITNTKYDFLSGGGKMGEYIRLKDWSKTPLGSPDTWQQSLRTAISICIASNFPICISWGPHRVQIYNDGYWPITGDMHPKSMGQDFKECWHSAWPVIGKAFEEATLGATRFLETQRIFLDRYGYLEETFFTFSFSPILDESGGVGGLFHPVIDQTQQTLAERRLNILPAVTNHAISARTSEEAIKLILDCLKDFDRDIPFVLLYSISADGKEANLEGSVGVEVDNKLSYVKINPGEQDFKSWPFAEVFKNGEAVQVEELSTIFENFNSGPYPEPPQQSLVFPIVLPGASHNNYFLVAGVSSRRRLDEKYRLFYDLLAATITNVLTKARAYEEERKKAEALAEIDRAKTVFFSNISHEFRTPLTLMLSPLEEILNHKKNNFSEKEIQNIETAQRNALRLLKLVNTLLDFSRIESGRGQAVYSLVDIVDLTKNLASNFRSVIEKAGLTLIIKADAIIQPVYVDKQMWEKIIFNLLSNAFKYTLEGSIIVELKAENDFAVLKVKDTGVGIPESEIPKMFERFHRVQNVAGRTHEGTGIGLSLIKELVQMHHGEISVESKLGTGSVFTIKIPFGKEHLNGLQILKTENDSQKITSEIYVEEFSKLLDNEEKNASNTSSLKKKIGLPIVLVVDDNADMRHHISSVLSNNFNVITASNGLDALHKMKETTPALVLSDVMMPLMDGIGLLKEIKSNKNTANIPVIFLTARAGEESRIEGMDTGADDYLVKPFSSKELLSRVKAQIKLVKLRKSLEGNLSDLFMEAPAMICVFRGPQHVFELVNEKFLQILGNRDILGKPAREALSEEESHGYIELLDSVYSTGVPFVGNEMPAQLDKGNGIPEEVYFNFVYQPSHNSDGEIDGVLVYGIDVTEQVMSRKKIEKSEKHQAFLLKLSDALRPLANPVDIEKVVTEITLNYMDADRCYYSTIEGDNVIILRDAARGNLPSVAGIHSISNFALYKAVLNAGQAFVVDEVLTSNILDEDLKKVCLQYEYGSFINVPVIKNGKAVGLFSLVESKPRKWTESEVQLTIETAERTWAAVERAKAEEALRKSEEQLSYDLTNAKKLQTFSTQLIHEEKIEVLYEQLLNAAIALMRSNMASIQLYHPEKKYLQLLAHKGYHPSTAAHWEWVSTNSQSVCSAALNKHERCIISDVEKDTYTSKPANLHYYQLSGIRSVQSTPLISRNGNLLGMISTCWQIPFNPSEKDLQLFDVLARQAADLIERKKTEEKIKVSEAKLRSLIDAAPIGIGLFIGRDLVVENPNQKFIDIVGKGPDIVGKPLAQVMPELTTEGQPFLKILDEVYTSGKMYQSYGENVNIVQNGVLHSGFYDINYVPLFDAAGKVYGIMDIATDVTEQTQFHQKIKASEEKFRLLILQAPVAICVMRGENYVIEVINERMFEMWDRTLEQVLNKPAFDVLPELKEQGFKELLDSVYKTGERFVAEELPINLRRNGKLESAFVKFVYEPLRESDGSVTGVMALAHEITEQVVARKKIEESEKFLELKVIQRTEQIEQKNLELEKMNKELEAFTYISSHDLQEPLRKIQTFVGRINAKEKDHLSANAKNYFERINDAATRMQTLIKDLLSFSRLNTSEKIFKITNLQKIVDDVKSDFKEVLEEKNATIITGELCELNIIPFQFRQLMQNLISNALKFIKPGNPPRIIINSKILTGSDSLFGKQATCHISVADNGIGFEKQFSEKIFEVFQKLHTKDEFAGTGIGLAIVKKIVENHNGIVNAESVLGEGVTFNIYIPM